MDRETANLKLVQDAYSIWAEGGKQTGADAFMKLLADDVRWYSLAGGSPGMEFTAKCQCKEDVQNYFAGLAKEWEMQHFTPEHYVAQGDWVVMRGSCGWRHRRTSKICETPKADFLCLRDGKVVEFHEFFDTAAALDAAR
jgi:hypothetical protein